VNILDAMKDNNAFAMHFRGGTWDAWRAFLGALFALPMTSEQLAIYQKHTGRSKLPAAPLSESWLICGRRSGKSFMLACIAVWLAAFKDWRPYLGPGEIGTIMIIAADRKQSRVIMRYCLGLLKSVPMLRQLVEAQTQESITLRNRVVLEIHTASFRSTRGYTIVAALLDELAYWPTDELSSSPDTEVINAIRPGMSTVPGAMLLCASSPYARRGALWDARRKHYGQDGDPILVWQAATREMNASVPQGVIDAALEEDQPRAQAEWFAQFRSDVEGFVTRARRWRPLSFPGGTNCRLSAVPATSHFAIRPVAAPTASRLPLPIVRRTWRSLIAFEKCDRRSRQSRRWRRSQLYLKAMLSCGSAGTVMRANGRANNSERMAFRMSRASGRNLICIPLCFQL
jgi:hypothetical protein